MKKLIFPLTLAVSILFTGCSNAQNNSEAAGTENQEATTSQVVNKDVNVAEFAKLVEQGNGLLLDVRTEGEYAEGHLEGSTLININGPDFQQKIKELDPETPVYVYCRSGARSGNAAKIMKQLGFKTVYNLEGGILAWQRSGKPVVR